jgi:hypothetical protein
MEIIDSNESNGINNFYIVKDNLSNRKYVVMHIVNGKFAIYDYEHHDVISKFKWSPNNGYACCLLKQEYIDLLPDITESYEINRLIYMHLLIKEYCLKLPKENEKHILHHINERRRDNRKENMIWISKNQQRALLKKIGKFSKPPVEIRPIMPFLPKHCKWINAKKTFWIDSHPACFLAVEKKEQKHKYIESLKGKKWTIKQKFDDFIKKWEILMQKPYGGQPSFYSYIDFIKHLELSNKDIITLVSAKAMENLIIHEIDAELDNLITSSAILTNMDDCDDDDGCDGDKGGIFSDTCSNNSVY